jgi:poly-gamma-glutamate synthesis protein (capsule biosynthesis protein)
VPAQIAAGIAAAGFDRCSLASNHVMDKGAAGIDATLAAFDAAGLGHSGMARTPDEARPQLFDVNGITVAHLSYTYSYNGMPVANGEPWRSNLIDPDRVQADARDARERGAELVILSLHWGAEGVTEVTADQRRWADQITASGAVDVIVGHHAHVVQPIEQVNGRWVVFGLGNFLSAMSASTECCGIRGQDGLMVRLTATEQPDGTFAVAPPEAIPTYVDRSDYVVLPVRNALADPTLGAGVGASALDESMARTSSVVGAYVTG